MLLPVYLLWICQQDAQKTSSSAYNHTAYSGTSCSLSSHVMDAQFRRGPPAGSWWLTHNHQIWDQVPQTPLNLSQGRAWKTWLTQYQWLLAMRACILCCPVNKATKGVKPLRLAASKAAQESARTVECGRRAELQTPSEREEKGYHLFLFYLLSSSMWKMIFTVSYLQSWIPCYFIP